MSKAKKIIIMVIAMIEMLMFSGVFYGYNSLIPIYKSEGVFSQFCDNPQGNETITCTVQETYFGRAFVTWLVVQAVMSFILGVILDKFGIRIMKVIAAICVCGGFICLGFTPKLNWLLFVAGSLLTMSAHCLGISNISLSVLFSGNANMFVSLNSALFDASAIVMSVIKHITDFGAPLWLVCSVYGGIGAIIILGSIILLKSRVEELVSDDVKKETDLNTEQREVIESTKIENTPNVESLTVLYDESVNQKYPTLLSCIKSPEYIIQVAFFVILCFRFTFYLAQMSSQLKYLFPSQQNVIDHLLSVSNIFFLGSLFISPIFGILLDRYQRYTFNYLSKIENVSHTLIYNKINACFFLPSCICSSAMLIASLVLFISNQYVFYLVFVCMTITRSLLFAINGAYIFSAFPKKFFGTLIGAVFLMTGLINLLQQVIIPFVAPGSHPDIVNYILLGMCAITFAHGFYLKFKK